VLQHQDTMKLFLGISCSAFTVNAWDYRTVSEWATEFLSCAAAVPNQSPINIDTSSTALATTTDPLQFQGLPDSATNPAIRHNLEINGHTWEMEWDVAEAAEDPYGVVYNNKVYALDQFHFHSPSEHTLDGNHYDLEAHMVHSCAGANCVTPEADDENLVVAIFMNVGAENPYLATIWPELGALAANSSAAYTLDDVANPYNSLVPAAPHDFYRYLGSTTTPTCVPNVEWFMMSTPVTLSQDQLTNYRTAISDHANTQTTISADAPAGVTAGWNTALGTNNRPLQIIGDRVVFKYRSPAEVAAENMAFLWHGVLIFAAVVVLTLCCLTVYMQLTKPKEKKTSRAVKPVKRKEPVPEETPLVQPQLFAQPQLQYQQMPMQYAQPQGRPFIVAP